MAVEKSKSKKKSRYPDELQREIWQYRRIWMTIIVLLVAARLLFPHFRNLKGWEQKITLATVEIGNSTVPFNATRINTVEEAIDFIKPEIQLSAHAIEIEGAIIIAVWKCNILSEKASCLRYRLKGQSITMALIPQPKNKQEVHDPFARAGWNGFFVIHKGLVMIVVSVLDANELKQVWPFIKEFPEVEQPKS